MVQARIKKILSAAALITLAIATPQQYTPFIFASDINVKPSMSNSSVSAMAKERLAVGVMVTLFLLTFLYVIFTGQVRHHNR